MVRLSWTSDAHDALLPTDAVVISLPGCQPLAARVGSTALRDACPEATKAASVQLGEAALVRYVTAIVPAGRHVVVRSPGTVDTAQACVTALAQVLTREGVGGSQATPHSSSGRLLATGP